MRTLAILTIIIALTGMPCSTEKSDNTLRVGAEPIEVYLPLIEGKAVALAGNRTSLLGSTHLADILLSMNVNIKVIFAPEHGFRDMTDAGAVIVLFNETGMK